MGSTTRAESLPSASLKVTPSLMSPESSAVAVYMTCPAPEFSNIGAIVLVDVNSGFESSRSLIVRLIV